MHRDDPYVRRSLQAGARGYLLKDAEELDLVRAVNAVARGDSFFSPALHPLLLSGYRAQLVTAQTPGQRAPRSSARQ